MYRHPAAKRADWSLPTEMINMHQNQINKSDSKKRAKKQRQNTQTANGGEVQVSDSNAEWRYRGLDVLGLARLQNRSAQLHALREKLEIALSIGDKSGGCVMRRRADDVGFWAGRWSGGG